MMKLVAILDVRFRDHQLLAISSHNVRIWIGVSQHPDLVIQILGWLAGQILRCDFAIARV